MIPPLQVWSYCALDWVKTTWHGGKVTPLTSPPLSASTIGDDLEQATKAHIVYLNLHGFAHQPYYYGQQDGVVGPTALTAEQVAQHDWSGVTVFAEVCFSAANGGGPIARAFLDNGARAFVGSLTEAYGRIEPVLLLDGEADRLAYLFIRLMRILQRPDKSLTYARRMLHAASLPLNETDRATLESFVCLEGKHYDKNRIS